MASCRCSRRSPCTASAPTVTPDNPAAGRRPRGAIQNRPSAATRVDSSGFTRSRRSPTGPPRRRVRPRRPRRRPPGDFLRRPRPLRASAGGGGANGGDVELETHLLAHHGAALREPCVVRQTPFGAIDGGGAVETGPLI